jgi:hypothetical protein
MTSSAKSVTTTTKTVNNNTGVTKSTSVKSSGGSTTVTKTTTIGSPKATSSSKSTSTPAKAAGAVLTDTRWITGPNDTRDLCAPVALANALLAATGEQASSGAIERLYRRAGGIGDSGVPVPSVLAVAAASGLAGCRLRRYGLTSDLASAGIALMELPGIPDAHAAAIVAGHAVMWGTEVPLDDLGAVILGAWSLTWHGLDA